MCENTTVNTDDIARVEHLHPGGALVLALQSLNELANIDVLIESDIYILLNFIAYLGSLCYHNWIKGIAFGVQSCKYLHGLFPSVLCGQPAGRSWHHRQECQENNSGNHLKTPGKTKDCVGVHEG